ncbi:nucleotidyltransferase domain-containing protein [Candidatus Sumerlaeota bacterium]|nr:nucleotidyltransferase domain-containing protein [Candidatus Sumerlaeota bacterium]
MDTSQTIRECRTRLENHYGSRFRGLVLFGSLARNLDTPESDVDLLVLLDRPLDYFVEMRRIVDLL